MEIEKPSRALVPTRDLDHVPQIDGRPGGAGGDDDVADLPLVLELAGGVDGQGLLADLGDAAGQGDVACAENVAEVGEGNAVGGQPLLGIVEKHPLLENT